MRGGNIGKTAVATERRLAKTLRDSEAPEAIEVVAVVRAAHDPSGLERIGLRASRVCWRGIPNGISAR